MAAKRTHKHTQPGTDCSLDQQVTLGPDFACWDLTAFRRGSNGTHNIGHSQFTGASRQSKAKGNRATLRRDVVHMKKQHTPLQTCSYRYSTVKTSVRVARHHESVLRFVV